jgi:hypothetical protein
MYKFYKIFLLIFLIIFPTKFLNADPFAELEKNVNEAIKQFNNNTKNLPSSSDEIVKSIDKIINKMSEGLDFTQEALSNGDITTTLSAIDLVSATLIETAATIPSETKSSMDDIDMEATFSEDQLSKLSKLSENKTQKQNNDTVELISTVKHLDNNGFDASNYADEVGTTIQEFSSKQGGFVQYTTIKRVNQSYVLASPNLLQPLVPGGVYTGGMQGMVIGPQLVFSPTGNFTEEARGPLEFWETEEYKKDFDEAYDRVKWPWLHKDNPLSEDEFKEMFPKWPDGVDYSGEYYEWAKFEYDGPSIDWPGLNPDGTCTGRRLVCQEQVEFNLNKLKENPTIVSYDDVIAQTEGTLINPEEIELSDVVVGDLGPDFDPNIITNNEIDLSDVVVGDLGPDFDPNIIANNEIDTSALTDEIDNLNETVSQVSESISDTTESMDSFMEEVDNLNETIADISESIDSDSITETVETISSTDDLVESIQSIGENLEESIQQVAEESNKFAEDLTKATEEYFQGICAPIVTWSWDTMSYSESTSCD